MFDHSLTQVVFLEFLRKTEEVDVYGVAQLEWRVGILFFERPGEVALVAPYERAVSIVGDDTLEFFVL